MFVAKCQKFWFLSNLLHFLMFVFENSVEIQLNNLFDVKMQRNRKYKCNIHTDI